MPKKQTHEVRMIQSLENELATAKANAEFGRQQSQTLIDALEQDIATLKAGSEVYQRQNQELQATLERERHDRDGGHVELLVVHEDGAGGKLGNCYYSRGYRVMSMHRLTDKDIQALHHAGAFGGGQECFVRAKDERGDSPWSEGPHYYSVESRTDSSD